MRRGREQGLRANGAGLTVWVLVRELRKQADPAALREAWSDAVAAADAPSADATEVGEIGVDAIWNELGSLRDARRSSHRCDGVAI